MLAIDLQSALVLPQIQKNYPTSIVYPQHLRIYLLVNESVNLDLWISIFHAIG